VLRPFEAFGLDVVVGDADAAGLFAEVLFAAGNESVSELGTALVGQVGAHSGQDPGFSPASVAATG